MKASKTHVGGQLWDKKARDPPRSLYWRTSEKKDRSKRSHCTEIQLMSVDRGSEYTSSPDPRHKPGLVRQRTGWGGSR